MDEIAAFRRKHGFDDEHQLARKVDLSAADQTELRRFFELRAQLPDASDDEIILRLLQP